ncbi:MAG TPA: oligogalacturonate lyase family protein [Opitutaceae bacterium]|nr:oligogalacturonate lyase family protein [Opitutaceae bacterium]
MPRLSLILGGLAAGLLSTHSARADYAASWVDPDTGHRVVQLSTEPGSACLYFTQYAYTAGGTKLLMTAPTGIDLVTLATGQIERVLEGRYTRVLQTGRKTGRIFYVKDDAIWALDPATKENKELAKIPPYGAVATINADETLAAGAITEHGDKYGFGPRPAGASAPKAAAYKPGETQMGHDEYPEKVDMMEKRLAARIPMTMITINLQTGAVTELLHSTDWLNHFQFSPTDPALLMFCHEGVKYKLDRIWLIRADGKSQPILVHQRTMRMEITGHEYWSDDGKWIWYDLQTPLATDYWVGGYNVTDQSRIWYHLPVGMSRSVHYNTSPDGALFSGDGSNPNTSFVHGKAEDTKWMFLFRPKLVPDQPGETPDQEHMVHAGRFIPEKLVNLAKHDYSLEPNGMFSPDGKWLIFRSNFRGPIGVFAVEVAKAK